nr:rap1 GTPase-GDP dissociation stimulator 1 [Leptinotarsa decemlineata]
MSDLLKKLTKATEDLNEQEIIDNLKIILSENTNIELNNVDLLNALLKIDKNEILKLASEVTAEWAKSEQNRKVLTNEEVISKLLTKLENTDADVVLHVIRAIGNICYENEEACNIIGKFGVDNFLSILKADCEQTNNALTTKTAGLFVNLFNLNDGIIRTALKNELMPILEQLLHKYSESLEENEILLSFLLSVLTNVENYLDEQDIPFTESLCQVVIEIFQKTTNPEMSVMAIEIFHGQSEKDEIKTLLAKEGVCELLFELIEKYRHHVNDEDSRSLLKMACDLIVVILTGDDCMHMLYNKGQGKVYKNMIVWLDSDDSDLLSTGVLAIGNFARKDLHCIQMVEEGISKKLMDILSKYNTSTDIADVKIQHALLSSLKNLVIPAQNKAKILKDGLIEVLYPMLKLDQYLVVFKLLGTFRMVIDGQESAALDLLSRVDFIERLIHWCYNSDHLGVRGEVPRLLAWLIKHCHSFKPFSGFLGVKDSVKCIIEMISSNHAVMQNEALYALNLLCTGCSSSISSHNGDLNKVNLEEKLTNVIIDGDIGKNISFVLTKYGDKMDRSTIDNLLSLLEQIVKSQAVCDHLSLTKVREPLSKLYTNPNTVQNITEKINKITSRITE